MKLLSLLTLTSFLLVLSGCEEYTTVQWGHDCGNYRGSWSGPVIAMGPLDAGIMNMNITQDSDSCRVKGAVALPPCVPVTPIKGRLTNGFRIVTADGALKFGGAVFGAVEKQADVGDPRPIGSKTKQDWVFTNVNNVPGCPASDSGFVELTKVSD